jgi:4-hydroxybenzoate polyprenyltransferase
VTPPSYFIIRYYFIVFLVVAQVLGHLKTVLILVLGFVMFKVGFCVSFDYPDFDVDRYFSTENPRYEECYWYRGGHGRVRA